MNSGYFLTLGRFFQNFEKEMQKKCGIFVRFFSAQEGVLLHFRANPGLWWGIFGKMDKNLVT